MCIDVYYVYRHVATIQREGAVEGPRDQAKSTQKWMFRAGHFWGEARARRL